VKTTAEVRALLGKHVRVSLGKNVSYLGSGKEVVVTGVLVGFGESGDFEIVDDCDSTLHYCWPMLDIEEVP
jgi:hypothetical protein